MTPVEQAVAESIQLVQDLHKVSPARATRYVTDLNASAKAASDADPCSMRARSLREQASAAELTLMTIRTGGAR